MTTITARQFATELLSKAVLPGVFTLDIAKGLREARFCPVRTHVIHVISDYQGVSYLLEVHVMKTFEIEVHETAAGTYAGLFERYCTA